MTTFVQQVEGVQPTDIGNQQIVKKDLSYLNTAAKAVDQTIQGADVVGTAIGKQRATDLVSEAQQTVDAERAEAEEFAKLEALGNDAGAKEVARKTALLEKGVAQGRITRENARLRVADLVTKGIEESPLLANKIRESATRLLGFNPQSEAAQQFFGSFQPSGTQEKMGTREKQAQFISANTDMSLSASRQLVAQQEMIAAQKSIRADQLALGDMTADEALAQRSIEDDLEGTNAVFGDAIALQREGKAINADTWAQLATKHENAFVQATLEEYRAAGTRITSAQESKVRENAKARYSRLTEQLQGFDQGFLNKQNLERLVTSQKLFGAQAMPVFSTLVNSFGDRIGSQILDLYANAAGKPERLQAALGANPALAPFVTMLSQDPKGFTQQMNNSLLKLNNPTNDLTATDAGLIDVFLKTVVEKVNPEDRQSVIEKLANKGLTTKAASVLSNAGPIGATPQEVQFMKNEWQAAKSGLPQQVAALIAELPDSSIELTPQGLVERAGTRNVKGRQIDRAANSDVTAQLVKINTLLGAANKGWGKALGISNLQTEATGFVDSINTMAAEIKEAKANEVPAAPTAGRVRAPVAPKADVIFVDLGKLEEAEPDRFSRLKAEAKRRQGGQ